MACLEQPMKVQPLPRSLLEKELESVGIRLNKHKPNIYFKVCLQSTEGQPWELPGPPQGTDSWCWLPLHQELSLPLSRSSPKKVVASPLTQQSH